MNQTVSGGLASLTEYAVVDRIIRHVELTFVAEKPPPSDSPDSSY